MKEQSNADSHLINSRLGHIFVAHDPNTVDIFNNEQAKVLLCQVKEAVKAVSNARERSHHICGTVVAPPQTKNVCFEDATTGAHNSLCQISC